MFRYRFEITYKYIATNLFSRNNSRYVLRTETIMASLGKVAEIVKNFPGKDKNLWTGYYTQLLQLSITITLSIT
jgi:hypothetical protein